MSDQTPPPPYDPSNQGGGTPPPPPPPSYGAPQYQQPAYGAPMQNGPGTSALVLGILGLLCCAILSIIAIVQGNKGKKLAAQGLASNGGSAQAGVVLGWIGVGLWIAGVLVWVILLATGHGSASFSTGTG